MKRFTETTKWNNQEFRLMSPATKLLWIWLNDNCDHAGIISPDFAVASLLIGQAVDEKNIAELKDRLKEVAPGTYVIRGFISFQFGDIQPKSSHMSNVHRLIWSSLESHNLSYDDPIFKVSPTFSVGSQNQPRRLAEPSIKLKVKVKEKGLGEKPERTESQKAAWRLRQRTELAKLLWLDKRKAAFPKERYALTGADKGQLRNLLKGSDITPLELIDVAEDAWRYKSSASFSYCRKMNSLAFLCNHLNEIRQELNGNPVAAPKNVAIQKAGPEYWPEPEQFHHTPTGTVKREDKRP